MKTQLKALGAALALAFSINASATLVVDSFTTIQADISDSSIGGSDVTSEIAAAEALGGFRELHVEKLALSTSVSGASKIGVSSDGWLNFDNGPGILGKGTVVWDGAGSTGLGGGLGMDLTVYGNYFFVNVINSDGGLYHIFLEATSSTGTSTVSVSGNTNINFPVAFGSLLATSGTGATLTSVTKLSLILLGGAGVDLSIDSANIPEPGSLALVGLGLLGLGAVRRRKA